MRWIVVLVCGCLFVSSAQSQQPPAAQAPPAGEAPAAGPKPEGTKNQASYIIGRQIGGNFRAQTVDIDLPSLIQGITEGLADSPSALTDEEMRAVMTFFQKELQQKQMERHKKLASEQQAKSAAFLKENAAKEGVVALPSGLQYKIVKAGNGPKPTDKDKVSVHYKGMLLDGKEFDSSIGGPPFVTPVTRVITGWTEALQLMPVGSKWVLYIPAELAYGEEGGGDTIPPNAALIFEVELLGIEK